VLDAYCGVGLLGAAAPGAELIAVEAHPAAVADARVNLAWRGATVVESPVERWRPCPVDSAIADPARHGLGAAGADVLAGTGAATVVLVSCDAGSLGRDAGLLGERGYDLDHCEVLDLFPHTPHVEVVSRFRRR
jgi:tRNA/tmRNA/rRNA uracil-C5-methylase (TrmA/RlmC/RlmD family)